MKNFEFLVHTLPLGAFVVQYDHKAKLRIIVQLHNVVSFCAMSLRESNLPFRGLSFWTNSDSN